MPKLSTIECEDSGKREGTKFGALTVRMMKRKRARKAAKQKRVSSHSDHAARGFA